MKKVYLSPSNQTGNIGAGNYGSESDRMEEIADKIKEELKYKFEVKVSNFEESMEKRVNTANKWEADVYISLHSNAGGGRGCEVFAYSSIVPGEKIARLIYNRLEKITPTEDRGVKYSTEFYELAYTKAPACLVEIAFHDNIDDANWIINNMDLISKEIAKAIYEYFGIEYTSSGTIYLIQKTLNERYGYKIAEDGIYGIETKKALTKALQTELNIQFNKNIIVDGIFGAETKKACENVGLGAIGNITWLIQATLVCKGYGIKVDGIYGTETQNAIKDFQQKNGLIADGICGKNTFERLFRN